MKTEFENNEVMSVNTDQRLYDAFNNFIFSNDTKVLAKLIARANLIQQVQSIPGDIVECGVFKGSGIVSWLKLKKILCPNSFKKVIGFDFFDTQSLLKSLSNNDQQRMRELFENRNFEHCEGESLIHQQIVDAGFHSSEFELVKGDVSITAQEFVNKRPGLKISLLYLDLDLGDPTYSALSAMWERVSRGGIIVFDEYAIHQWSESQGVDKFFADKGIKINILNFMAPNAYVIKE